MPQQSAIFPIYLRSEYRDTGALNRFQSDTQRVAQSAKREFQGVGAALDQALSRQRNGAGSLDLGVDELRQAALAQQQVAIAAREVAEATKRAALQNGEFDQSLSRAARSAFQLANAEERSARELLQKAGALDRVQEELDTVASKTDLVATANRRSAGAFGAAARSQGALRNASIQAGQQLQDIQVQLQAGTRASLVFSQQLPQLAFALSGLRDSTDATSRRVGQFATFLSGPWGVAVFGATAALGPLVAKLFEKRQANDKAAEASARLADQLDLSRRSYDAVVKAAREYNAETERSAETSLMAAQAARLEAVENLKAAEAKVKLLQATSALIAGTTPSSANTGFDVRNSADIRAAQLQKEISDLKATLNNTTFDLAVEQAAIQGDEAKAIAEGYAVARQQIRETTTDIDEQREALLKLNAEEKAALDALNSKGRSSRSAASAARRAAREAERLAQFGARAAESIARINERFDEQPRLVDQAAQATRQLDRLIAELTDRQPAGFRDMADEAERAKNSIAAALQRPFDELLAASKDRLAVEALIARGRDDEAAALLEVLRLESTIGDVSAERAREIEEQIRYERERTEEYRAQRELLEAQVDVARTVGDELRSALSGRSSDFIGNVRQSLLDLRGARIFEDLFGDTFRSLEEDLRGNTPESRANARYIEEVKKTSEATEAVATNLFELAASLARATAQISGLPANDNIPAGNNNDVIERRETAIARLSVIEISDRISEGVSLPIASTLEDLLGPRFADMLGSVVGGAVAGEIIGGAPGAILGGARSVLETGVLGNDNRITRDFGIALEGAGLGTQVNAISRALGLGGSAFGGQVGGALGASLKIPGADIVGAIAGNFLGSLLGGTKRGSATIGGIGNELSIVGVRGNSSSREGAASGLAGDVLAAISSIADQLGATVNAAAGSVSIGVRKDNLRVDPTGRGITKTSNGAIDFGNDTEGAIRFAARDLILDNVIQGLTDAESSLLRQGDSLEAAVQDVLDFRGVFDRLQEIQDPVGFAISQLNDEFKDLIELFNRAGASASEFADLEELYNLERAEALERASDRVVGSLKRLLDDLTLGDNGLSLRTRQSNAEARFDDLSARVRAGDTSAFDDFAEVSQQLLDIDRQILGSTQGYFDRLTEITALTERAIGDQTNVVSMAGGQSSPFDDVPAIDRSIDIMTETLAGHLRKLDANLVEGFQRLINVSGGGGTALTARKVANF